MKTYFTLIFGLMACGSLWGQSHLLLPEAVVVDSLIPKEYTGQKLYGHHPKGGQTDAQQSLLGQNPLNIRQAGPGLLAGISLRGVSSDGIMQLWNGMPINSPGLGTSDLNTLYFPAQSQLYILPGGNGPQLGSSSIGGTVFIENSLPFSPLSSNELQLGYGSFQHFNSMNRLALADSNWSFYSSSYLQTAQNDYPYTDPFGEAQRRLNSAFNRIGWQAGLGFKRKQFRYQAHGMVQDLEREIPESSIAFNPSNPNKSWQSDRIYRLQQLVDWKQWHFEQGFAREEQYYEDLRADIRDTNIFQLSATEFWRKFALSPQAFLQVSAYLNYYQTSGSNTNQEQSEYGIRAEYKQTYKSRLTYSLAISSDFVNESLLKNLDTNRQWMPLLASASLWYKLNEQLRLRAHLADIFHNPTINERYWPGAGVEDLQPESGYNAEMGVDHNSSGKRWFWRRSFTAYYLRLQNRVRWISNGGTTFRPVNIAESRSLGFELQEKLGYSLSQWDFSLQTNLQYTDARVIKDISSDAGLNNQLIFVPKWSGGALLQVDYQNNTKLWVEQQYSSGIFTTEDNDPDLKTESFVIFNLGMSHRFRGNGIDIIPSLEVRNFTDRAYVTQMFQPMPGINFYTNLKFQFQL